jgi:hypothetical protein
MTTKVCHKVHFLSDFFLVKDELEHAIRGIFDTKRCDSVFQHGNIMRVNLLGLAELDGAHFRPLRDVSEKPFMLFVAHLYEKPHPRQVYDVVLAYNGQRCLRTTVRQALSYETGFAGTMVSNLIVGDELELTPADHELLRVASTPLTGEQEERP